MKGVAIVGAGAMGCLFAARLAQGGANVTLIDIDARRIARIAEEGLLLDDDAGRSHVRPGAALAADFAGPVDLAILFTKGNHSEAAVRSIAHLARFAPAALTLQNGLGNAEILAATFGADRVLMGTAHVPADLAAPTRVETHGFAHIHLGGYTPAAHALAPAVAGLFEEAGFRTHAVPHAEAAIWEKLAFNAALNALAMIAGAENGAMNNPPGRRIAHTVVAETAAVARARGFTLDEAAIHANVDLALAQHAGHKASMLQDREAGRPTEIEFINGAVARAGEALGVATPVTSALADIVRVIEAKERG